MDFIIRLPSRKASWTFWVGFPFILAIGYICIDLALGATGIYQQGAVKSCGILSNGKRITEINSTVFGSIVPRSVDIAIFVVSALISLWCWSFAVKRFFSRTRAA